MSSKSKEGIVHIYASPNNTLMLLTDITGAETIGKCTGGQVTKAQHKEGEPYTAMKIAEKIADLAREKEIFEVTVKVRGPGGIRTKTPGKGSEAAIRSLTRNGLRIKSIENVTPSPHDGCRRKKKFRARKK
ncbi:MAG: 30S ribosomal protein S11 [Candidatus Diapherotrites archaeon]|nr:30S ribosomal protein S11 [Candidatus Diapherotrites archaeon]